MNDLMIEYDILLCIFNVLIGGVPVKILIERRLKRLKHRFGSKVRIFARNRAPIVGNSARELIEIAARCAQPRDTHHRGHNTESTNHDRDTRKQAKPDLHGRKGCREPHELTCAKKIALTKQLFPGIDPAYAEQWLEARK